MIINVTEKHVNQACIDLSITPNKLGYCCPVSQCLREMFPEIDTIVTGIDSLMIGRTEYSMSKQLEAAILEFDTTNNFPVGTYIISPLPRKTFEIRYTYDDDYTSRK